MYWLGWAELMLHGKWGYGVKFSRRLILSVFLLLAVVLHAFPNDMVFFTDDSVPEAQTFDLPDNPKSIPSLAYSSESQYIWNKTYGGSGR